MSLEKFCRKLTYISQFLNFYMTYVTKQNDINLPKFNLDKPEESFKNLETIYYDEEMKIKIYKVGLNLYLIELKCSLEIYY